MEQLIGRTSRSDSGGSSSRRGATSTHGIALKLQEEEERERHNEYDPEESEAYFVLHVFRDEDVVESRSESNANKRSQVLVCLSKSHLHDKKDGRLPPSQLKVLTPCLDQLSKRAGHSKKRNTPLPLYKNSLYEAILTV